MQETQEMRVWSLGVEDPLEKEMATHSSILAWRIPWTEEPGRLQTKVSHRIGHNWACMHRLNPASYSILHWGVNQKVGCFFFLFASLRDLSHPHMTTGKTIAFTRRTFVGKVMSPLFNMLSSAAIHGVSKSWTRLSDWTELNWGWSKLFFQGASVF